MISELGADEIVEWMAFIRTENPEYMEQFNSRPIEHDSEGEAKAIKDMFLRLKKTNK